MRAIQFNIAIAQKGETVPHGYDPDDEVIAEYEEGRVDEGITRRMWVGDHHIEISISDIDWKLDADENDATN